MAAKEDSNKVFHSIVVILLATIAGIMATNNETTKNHSEQLAAIESSRCTAVECEEIRGSVNSINSVLAVQLQAINDRLERIEKQK